MVRILYNLLIAALLSKSYALPENYQGTTKEMISNLCIQKDPEMRSQDSYYNLIKYNKFDQPLTWEQSFTKFIKSCFYFSKANAIVPKTIQKNNKIKSKMDHNQKTQVLIIGSGPAGYSAAIYAARANLKPILISGHEPGGQLTITTDVENYPGFANTIQGPWLMEQMRAQVEKVGTQMVTDQVTQVNLKQSPFEVKTEKGHTYHADSIIIATGAQAKWLNIPSETHFRGYGVSGCATCDGFFYKGKVVGVVGGGNTAVEEALFLTNFASKVYLFHRRDQLRAEKMLQKRLLDHPKIEVIWDVAVDEVLGNDNPKDVTGVRLKHTKTGALQEIKLHGLFVAIGHSPTTALFKNQLNMDDEGYLIVKPGTTDTNIPGVFAAGDVADKVYRQAITAAGLGCIAALDAERFLAKFNLAEKR